MPSNKRTGNRPPEFVKNSNSVTTRFTAGTYIGVVKNNTDSLKRGRLQVWLPDMGGNPDEAVNWITVSYASPFFGSTNTSVRSEETTFNTIHNTYGMWFVAPDLENKVLVTFVNGDPQQGYWFACIPSHNSHGMVPAIGARPTWNDSDDTLDKDQRYPVTEINENTDSARNAGALEQNERPLHTQQYESYLTQGLQNDRIRGPISSSSQRESPSAVFGISTPGRPNPDPKDDPFFLRKIESGEVTKEEMQPKTRKGGHTFVMDDGDIYGDDSLIRMRTAKGHQIMMNDSGETIYISNSAGSVWVELANDGHLHVYSASGVNIRTEGSMNLHSDMNININAGNNINIKAGGSIKQESDKFSANATTEITLFSNKIGAKSTGQLLLDSTAESGWKCGSGIKLTGSKIMLNSGSTPSVEKPSPIQIYSSVGTAQSSSGKWGSRTGGIASAASIVPTHEPFQRKFGAVVANSRSPSQVVASKGTPGPTSTKPSAIQDEAPDMITDPIECNQVTLKSSDGGVVTDSSGTPIGTTSTADPGPASAYGKLVKKKIDKSYVKRADCPVPNGGIGPLSVNELKCLMAQIGWRESTWDYRARNSYGYIGKYQFGAMALVDRGYIKLEAQRAHGNKAMAMSSSWTGKDNIRSIEDWFNATEVQEKVMFEQMKANYATLMRISGLSKSDDVCTVAGMLSVSHLLGAGGAKSWRKTGGGQDANGTTGADYFNSGRYAVDVLTKE